MTDLDTRERLLDAAQDLVQRVGANEGVVVFAREEAAVVDGEGVGEALGVAGVGHVVEEAEGVGVGERAVLAPAIDVVAALDVVQTAEAPQLVPEYSPAARASRLPVALAPANQSRELRSAS